MSKRRIPVFEVKLDAQSEAGNIVKGDRHRTIEAIAMTIYFYSCYKIGLIPKAWADVPLIIKKQHYGLAKMLLLDIDFNRNINQLMQ